jgi:hypothetical protein
VRGPPRASVPVVRVEADLVLADRYDHELSPTEGAPAPPDLLVDVVGTMADATHLYVVFSGGYTDHPEEHWQFGVRFLLVNSVLAPDPQGTLPTFGVTPVTVARTEAHWTIESTFDADLGVPTFHPDDWLNDQLGPICDANFGTGISTKVRLDAIKVSPINASGHVEGGMTAHLEWTASNPTGADSANILPLENSIVVSLQTPRIGRKGRGRYYLPPATVSSVNADGLIDSTKLSALLANQVTFLEGMAVNTGIIAGEWALPIVTGSPWTQYGIVQSINIGNVFDTQRRRRRQQVEVRSSSAVSF